ncbi:hypothetical protein BDV32DRAFT_157361 [Aspergillus pseudonomiae]|nr:hypothetical protein BDV32DRAFT_157361 [Aspergillus pseudonomiae]
MSVPESPKRRQLRKALRALTNHVAGLKEHEFGVNQAKAQNIHILPMDLDQQSPSRPTFFASRPIFREPRDGARNILEYFHHYVCACALFSKDWVLNEPWCPVSLGDVPFVNLNDDHSSPEFVTSNACQVKDGPYPHLKAMVYNNLDRADGIILRGEVTIALRLIIAQMRRDRFIEHMTSPVLFSFMGPQQVRLVEAYFNGSSVVVRPSRLFDLRTKNEAVLKRVGTSINLKIFSSGFEVMKWQVEGKP